MKGQAAPPPFEVIRPDRFTPLIYAVAHAGRTLPDDGAEALQASQETIRSLEDPLVDQLVAGAEALGVTVVLCRISRAHIDVNRDPAEIDPELLSEPGGGKLTPRTRAGLGVVPRLGADARRLHRRRLSLDEVQTRIDSVHAPYHQTIEALMGEARAAFGRALLVDWHSMPSSAATAEARRGGMRPDIVIGDRHGQSAAGDLAGVLRAGFESVGRRVLMNRPFAGGYTTQSKGRPDKGLHALQVEIDRSLYLDETVLEATDGLGGLRAEIQSVTRRLQAALEPKKTAPGGAA